MERQEQAAFAMELRLRHMEAHLAEKELAAQYAAQAAQAMADVFKSHGLGAVQHVGAVDSRGARVERVEER